MGNKCNEREDCARFTKGKEIIKSNTPAWWMNGKDGSEVYKLCPDKIKEE